MQGQRIRESVIAGSWYPGDPEVLKKDIAKFLEQAEVAPLRDRLVGLVAPHAGYIYSGGVAAHAYKLLLDQPYDRVLVLAPSHRAFFQGASVYKPGPYRTPLGVVPLDAELIDSLCRRPISIDYVPQAHEQEHSLEIQLPFLQVALGQFSLTPIVMGEHSRDQVQQLAKAIAESCRDKNVLLVASSDLSHFHSYDEAKRLDRKVLERVAGFDAQGLAQDFEQRQCEACGAGPIVTVMLAARLLGANQAQMLHYANSGDVTGDMRGVVGYMSAAFYQKAEAGQGRGPDRSREKVGVDLGLNDQEKQTLREIAQQAVRSHCFGEPIPEISDLPEKLKEPKGAFVCFHKGGNLRGCIGMIEGREPLHITIQSMAIQAAFSDPRFCPLEPSELDQIDMEISVLTPLQRITDPALIEIGKHGVLIRRGYYSGLLLPQVATDNDWDRQQFLEWTCKKAGLPNDAWQDPASELFIFSADIF